ncbi:MAG: hypothetical protein CMJ36_05890, partial [Phycisphaerae bacterium]|nr:hypothetical protein [Phycisphaerae bacterium]
DRRGRILATTTLGYRAFLDPAEIADPGTIGIDLQSLVGLDAMDTDRALARRFDTRFVPVSGILEPWQVDRLKRAGLAGVGLEPRLVRHYPHGGIAEELIGAVGFEHTGLGGLEHALDRTLQGEDGHITVVRDVRNRILWVEDGEFVPHRDGADRRLTIDAFMQELAEERLSREVLERNAAGGRLIIADPSTGDILALADVVNHEQHGRDEAHPVSPPDNPRLARPRCGTDPYEPGSTFKPFVWAVATEAGAADPEEILQTPSSVPYRTRGNRRIRDVHYYGPSSWRTVLVKSMNSGMAIVAERMNHRQMQEVLHRFGFGTRTRCGIPGETGGIVTSPDEWTDYTQVSVSMGHEIAVTPLQMIRAFSVFCTDGHLPTLRILGPGPERISIEHRVIDPVVARMTRDTMRSVMTDGTGRASQSEFYQLFGKSGTAQLPIAEGGGYHEDRYVSSFIAGAPLDMPRLVALCVIEDPDKRIGHYYGGRVAGPVVRDVLEQSLSYLGVAPDVEGVDSMPKLAGSISSIDIDR